MAKPQTPETDPESADASGAAAAAPSGGRKKLIIIVAGIVVLLALAGGAYATGLLGKLTGAKAAPAHAAAVIAGVPGSVDLPEITANLNGGPRRTVFMRLKARLELADKSSEPAVQAAIPHVQDLFQTYLRDMRPEELQGSAGTYRLREELMARANIAVAPARVTEILFIEMLVQ